MTIRNPLQLKDLIKPGQRLLGLDLGMNILGLALSDVSLTVATPLTVVARQSLVKDLDTLIQTMREYEVGGVVIGLPLQMDGTEGTQAAVARAFVCDLLRRIDTEISFWDERFSSLAMERMLIREANLSRKRRKAVIDKVAAAYILQGVLNYLASVTPDADIPGS